MPNRRVFAAIYHIEPDLLKSSFTSAKNGKVRVERDEYTLFSCLAARVYRIPPRCRPPWSQQIRSHICHSANKRATSPTCHFPIRPNFFPYILSPSHRLYFLPSSNPNVISTFSLRPAITTVNQAQVYGHGGACPSRSARVRNCTQSKCLL